MALDFNKFGWHKTFSMAGFDLSTDEMTVYLTDLQSSNLMFNGENVFAKGSEGENLISFSHTGTVSLEAVSNLYELNTMGEVLGTTPIVGATTEEVYKIEKLTVTSNTATTEFTALGTVGAELKYAFVVNSDGSRGAKLTQSGATGSQLFTYTAGTKTVTLDSGEVADNGEILVYYTYTTGASTVKLTKKSDVFSKALKIVLTGVVRDQCTETDYLAQCVIPKMKLTNEMNINPTSTADPATMNVSGEGMKACANSDMCNIYIVDETEST